MKMWKTCVACVVVGLFVVSCNNSRPPVDANPVEMNAMSVSELLREPGKWDGKKVRVAGFFYFEAPSSVLFESRESFVAKKTDSSLWVGKDCPGSTAERTPRANRKNVVIEGVFRNEPLGVFNQFPAQIECVELFQVAK